MRQAVEAFLILAVTVILGYFVAATAFMDLKLGKYPASEIAKFQVTPWQGTPQDPPKAERFPKGIWWAPGRRWHDPHPSDKGDRI